MIVCQCTGATSKQVLSGTAPPNTGRLCGGCGPELERLKRERKHNG